MEKWKLNVELLQDIFEICRRPVKATLESLHISYSTWVTWMNVETGKDVKRSAEKGGITVVALVKICNALCVPVRGLFYKEGEQAFSPIREDLVWHKNRFTPSRFDTGALQKAFGIRSQARLSIEKMLTSFGYTIRVYNRWIKEDSSLRVAQLLRFCEMFHYDPFSFLVDNNTVSVKNTNKEPALLTEESEKGKLQKDIISLRKRNSKLSALLKEKCEAVGELSKEVLALKVDKHELESEIERLKRHIESIEPGSYGLVAENDFQVWGKKGGSKEKLE